MLTKFFSKAPSEPVFEWNHLVSEDQLDELETISQEKPVLIFKHSTRCSISAMTLRRFERSADESISFQPFFLDLIANRSVSNLIAEKYGVRHESPQAILLSNGKAIFDASHTGISFEEINKMANKEVIG